MAGKTAFILVLLAASLCLAGSSQALIGSIQPPRMVLRAEAPGTVSGFVNVINSNDVPVSVHTDIFGDIQNITQLSDTNMTLQPNETRRVDFDVQVSSGGNYAGEIIFIFSDPESGTQGAALSSTIIILAEGEAQETLNQTGNESVQGTGMIIAEWYVLPAGIALAVIIASLAIYKIRSA